MTADSSIAPSRPKSEDRPALASPSARTDDGPALRESLECIVLPVREGAKLSGRPPVEIYLGTEPAQYRANRVFVYSIEKVRDPGREVRIYLMSLMPGFNRRFWTTGFTNYRFALPALAGGTGRAIYNDEDQIYLTDPGVLFDHEMGDASVLSISDTESSVMLVDCERMAEIWTLDGAQNDWKRGLLRAASKATGHRGELDPGWNARDEEFVPGESHLLHYTTLHTQPWRPFPERFVYQKGSHTRIWHDLEQEAIEEGFEIFHREAPSQVFSERIERLRDMPQGEAGSGIDRSGVVASAVENLCGLSKARALLELTPDFRCDGEERSGRFGLDVERRVGLLEWLSEVGRGDVFEGVACVGGLEALPVWDVPWIIDELFARSERFVFVAARCPEDAPGRRFMFPPAGTAHTPDWWRSHFESASIRHPEISWELMTARGNDFVSDRIHVERGGPRLDSTPPSVWTLTDGEPGNETQVRALTQALGWPSESHRVSLSAAADLPFMGQGAHRRGLETVSRDRSTPGPWPDLLIAAGRRIAPVARKIREESKGRTIVVALGAKTATPADQVDLAVTPVGANLFPHPNRFEVDRPLVPIEAPAVENSRWSEKILAAPGPRLVALVGSGTRRLGLDQAGAERFGRLVADSARALGASVLISGSRHVEASVFGGFVQGVGTAALVHQATRDQRADEQPWPALLENADLFVLVGLGEVTLAEITATGRPVFLAPQQSAAKRPWERLRDGIVQAIVERAVARPENDRGTTRPQEGLELISAKLIERGWIRPRRDVEALRGRLVRNGRARLLRGPLRPSDLAGFASPVEPEVLRVAEKIRRMLGTLSETDGDES